MKKTTVISRSSIILLFGIMMSAIVLGTTIYQLQIPCSVTTKASYLLQLKLNTVEVTTINFGQLGVGQTSYKPSLTEFYKIINIGDVTVNVTWSCIVPTGFRLEAFLGTPDVDPTWTQGDIVELVPSGQRSVSFKLTDESAAPDTTYNFDIYFEVVE